MRKVNLVIAALTFLFVMPTLAQTKTKKPAATKTPAKTAYETVPGDPLKARIYTLSNGLKVYMSVYKDAPRIQTLIAVKAGSKNDPADATGLAHYLEHMLFKGTDKYGSLDYSKEKPELDKIEALYEVYRKTKDPVQRKKIYHEIDSVSGVAAKFAIANEYDKMTAAIGCEGTNAFTSFEQTCYVNDVPSNQLENFLTIEAERFRNPVMRIFHTELEAVYEEKNISLDADENKVWDGLFSGLFVNHPYGTQTTIGTIDHLKNPSITEIKKYYKANYVPNNMAIILAGDFDPDKTIQLIEKKFGYMQSAEVPAFTFKPESPIEKPVVKEVFGPEAEGITIGFRFQGAGSNDANLLKVIGRLLYNGKAGLLDLNLNKKQLVVNSVAYDYALKDYSCLFLDGSPKENQSLDEVKTLLLGQLEALKKGDFPEWMLQANINQVKLERIKRMQDNAGRAYEMLGSFVKGLDWKKQVEEINTLSKITKAQVIEFVKNNFNQNYVAVYKRTGEDKNVQKVEKPEITPVEVNRDKQSPFLTAIVNSQPPPIQPVFADYEKDILKLKLANGVSLNYTTNKEDATFDLFYIFDIGSKTDPLYPLAIRYLKFIGTSDYTPEQMAQEFYKIGCSFDVFNGEERIYVKLSGLTENFEPGLKLFEHLLSNAVPQQESWNGLVQNILKDREDSKLDKDVILYSALVNYGKYGPSNPFTNILSEEQLKNLKPSELTDKLKGLESFEHRVLYYGNMKGEQLKALLAKYHPATPVKPVPPLKNYEVKTAGNTVYVVDFDMKQAEIIMMCRGKKYDPALTPGVALYNEYFGGGMSSIVFQDLRESKALAYSAGSYFNTPSDKEKYYMNSASIGTQTDKLPEALAGMVALLRNMPLSEPQFNSAKAAVVQRLRTERVNKENILFDYEDAMKMGHEKNLRPLVFDKVQKMNLNDVANFQAQNVKEMSYTTLVLGKKSDLDIETLKKYGTVTFLTLKDIFGY